MNQLENSKRKLSKIVQNLAIEIDTAGLSQKIQVKLSNDPWSDLENAHQSILTFLLTSSQPSEQLIKSNELVILDCLKNFVNIHQQISRFSKMLYEGNYSLQIYKSYRKLYQQISLTSNCLYQFESEDPQFLKYKEQLITQNLQVCEQIQGVELNDYKENDSKREEKKQSQQDQLIENLRKQNQMLNDLIRQNDQQFTLQIQRYNNTLYDMQETIREYQVRMDKIRQYETVIDDLQHKVIRLKEQKYRDDMLIDNMSKKIRYYEKERGGIDVFLSPRASRKQVISPSRLINHSMFSPQLGVQHKGKNYFGERLTTH